MAINQDWRIRASTAQCALTGARFADGEPFYTCIFEDSEGDGFVRRDYSLPAWQQARSTLDPPPYSFWRSTHKAPPETADRGAEMDTSAEGMLRRFVEEDDPRTENARYILALMLERKKTLVPVDAKEAETRTLLFYEHAGSGEVFIVADPGLRLEQIESVQAEVSALLAEEEARAAAPADGDSPSGLPGEGEEVADDVGEAEEDKAEEKGEQPEEAEDDAVPRAGQEALETD